MKRNENYDLQLKTAQKKRKESFSEHTAPLWFFWRARRYVVILLIFFGMASSYTMRSSLSIAIVAMTQLKNITLGNESQIVLREFEWDTVLQGYALSSFFYGFLIAQLISGYMSVTISGKLILTIGIGGASLLTLLTPLSANFNFYLFLVLRAGTGFFEGIFQPALVSLWAKWAPPLERNRLVNFCQAGSFFGMIISLSVSSLVCEAFGWKSIFYLFGSLGTLWTILWITLVSNSPHEDSRICEEELNYLIQTLNISSTKKVFKTPWKDLMTSIPVWAMLVVNFIDFWGFYTFSTQMPKFMRDILNYGMDKTGIMSSLPYILLMVMIIVSGIIADYLIKKKWIGTTNLRKLYVSLGFSFQCIFLILAVYLLTPMASTLCILLAIGLGGFASSIMMVNYLDLSPRFGSIIMGLSNLLGSAVGIISPTITGYIVTEEGNVYQWRVIFYISAGFYFLGIIFYSIFGSGEIQNWNDSENIQEDEQQKIEFSLNI